ncbi:virulence factor SrfC family protein [Ancylobacter amanitiformis]|uniref:Virulence factor n=1 Tax=Ancylobacter amanitiformis TaxID=217069 RepID=A0ABU0LPW7_9HYPH|nr:virulence factor SrfC family protein [Ancylobacter amanitiformis]MDQ0510747.1 hypothetical protein [Ancylobacter amanitiformis]
MTDIREAVAQAANDTVGQIRAALAWLDTPKNADRVGDPRGVLGRDLARGLVSARRLAEAARRPMAVAVFGPSQAGKSHLVSVLARKEDTLHALFDGEPEPVSYIKRINPDTGRETTGLVTRFTIHRRPTPAGYPVDLQLLSHADIIKILGNAYFFDGNPARYETWPEREEIVAHIAPFRGGDGVPRIANGLDPEDVWEMEEYFARYLPESELTRRLKTSDFWSVAASAAPSLQIERLGTLFSILWGRHQVLTDMYVKLVDALRQLGFASQAFAPFAAVDVAKPGVESIIDIESLKKLALPTHETITLRTSGGGEVPLARTIVTALTAELRICVKDKPWDFFEHTDILDFPGYRSRGLNRENVDDPGEAGATGLARALRDHPAETVFQLIRRGKVEYLFQRYVADQEITAMLLCIKDGPQEVVQLPDVVARWIAATHGATTLERQGKPVLLYFVLTKFDLHFEEKPSDEALGLAARFTGRLDASLVNPYGSTSETWVRNWTAGRPFKNAFLMRNPSLSNRAIFELDGSREVDILPGRKDWVARLKAAFVSVPAAQDHFADPARAFEEMIRLNDGGASYIASELAGVCNPQMKSAQVRDRLLALRARVSDMLQRYHVSTDVGERIAERLAVADRVLDDLYRCDNVGRMGSLIRGLMIDPGALSDSVYRVDLSPAKAASPASLPAPVIVPAGRVRPGQTAAPAPAATASPGERPKGGALGSVAERQAHAALEAWILSMSDIAGTPAFTEEMSVGPDNMREIATELAAAARRLGLSEQIAAKIEMEAFAADRRDLQLEKATVISAAIINAFVADLGLRKRPEEERRLVPLDSSSSALRAIFAERPTAYDAAGIAATPEPFRTTATDDWLYALYKTVQDNAASEGGLSVDPVENGRLGSIIAGLSGPI